MKFNTSKFVWGEVLKAHQIGNYKIIEYYPYIYDDWGSSTGEINKNVKMFHPYIGERDTNTSYESLDMALIGVIAINYEGPNTCAHNYIFKMLSMKEGLLYE